VSLGVRPGRHPRRPAGPADREFRHAILAGLSDIPKIPGPRQCTSQHPGLDLLEFCRDRQDEVLRFTADTGIWPTNNISERGVRPLKTRQKISAGSLATKSPRTASTSTPPASMARTSSPSCALS
jgi:Transposase IS66 family